MTKKSLKDFAKRLNEALDDNDVPIKGKGRNSWLAKQFKVAPKSARAWAEGLTFPDTERAIDIVRKLGVNLEWLLTGRGHKNNMEASEPDDQIFFAIFENLDKEAKKEIMSYAAFVLERMEENATRKPTSKDVKTLIK